MARREPKGQDQRAWLLVRCGDLASSLARCSLFAQPVFVRLLHQSERLIGKFERWVMLDASSIRQGDERPVLALSFA